MITPILVYIYDRKKKAGPKTAASVELRLTLERKSKYITTGVRLLPKEWHNGIVVNRPDSAELNELLDSIMVRARKVTHAMIEAGELNLDEIPRRMEELTVDKRLFYDFCVDRTKVRIYGKSKDTAARYNRFLDWLKNWSKIIYFSDVTDRNIIKMDEELSANGMKNYSKWNNYHRFLNSFIIDAMAWPAFGQSGRRGCQPEHWHQRSHLHLVHGCHSPGHAARPWRKPTARRQPAQDDSPL